LCQALFSHFQNIFFGTYSPAIIKPLFSQLEHLKMAEPTYLKITTADGKAVAIADTSIASIEQYSTKDFKGYLVTLISGNQYVTGDTSFSAAAVDIVGKIGTPK
jgi:hypothetical protein